MDMMTKDEFDIIDVEVHQKSIRNIASEMAVTLMRTSGSPVVTDAKDFSTSILDHKVEQLGFAGHVTFHVSTAVAGVEAVLRNTRIEDIAPGDGFICNDPHTSGAIHQGDVGIVMPFFAQGEIVGWGYVNAHLLDVGGSAVSGFAAGAFDNYSEALAFPAVRVIREGRIDEQWQRFISNNVRMAGTVINDIRSMIAANNVGSRRIAAMIDEIGLDRFRQLNEQGKCLSEKAMRDIISRLPDGTYDSSDWVEYDGRGIEGLHEIRVRLLVRGDEMTLQFRGGPQVNCFINGAWPAVVGQSWTTILAQLAYDIPVNAGIWRPITFDLGPSGTLVNSVAPAPVTMSHIQTGMRVNKLLADVFSQACSLSEDPVIASRVASQSAQDQTYFTAFGMDRRNGQPTVAFPMSVGMSTGGPAQTNSDGMEVYAAQCMSGCDMPDVELEETSQPGMILWRRVAQDTGGAGVTRGGLGVDTAMAILHCDRMNGGAYTNTALIPPRGSVGGFPGAAGYWKQWRKTNLVELLDRHVFADIDTIAGEVPQTTATVTDFEVVRGDIYHVIHGGGGGLGDPLRRDPGMVARDVSDGFVSADMARDIYGVILDAKGAANTAATAARRSEIRKARIGDTPRAAVAEDAPLFAPLKVDQGHWRCTACGEDLGRSRGNWRDNAVATEAEVSVRFAALHSQVRHRKDGDPVMMREYYCPGCASSLSVDIALDSSPPTAAPRIGEYDPYPDNLILNS
ncbi:MAG: hydantoinase B/oxoprolinase family protein [Novosphingobium sp.]|nr:hydantoinase B/oxoprolinase family protein [Novosphingobium sp.]MCP5389069.1 hydantoinase B/oxoprolinase family protein [Novosphingobium sp.]